VIDEINDDARQRMEKSISVLKGQLSKIRTGRAHPSLLDVLWCLIMARIHPLNS
jgi:ribosome recycling factor